VIDFYRGQVRSVRDDGKLDLVIDLGFFIFHRCVLAAAGINESPEFADFARDWLDKYQQVYLQVEPSVDGPDVVIIYADPERTICLNEDFFLSGL